MRPQLWKDEGSRTFTMRELLNGLKTESEPEKEDASSPYSQDSPQQHHIGQNSAAMELINSVVGVDEEGRSRQRILTFAAKRSIAPRWKGKDAKAKKNAEAEALKEPISKIISQLQSSLVQSDTNGILSGNVVHFTTGAAQIDLLDKACLGRPMRAVEKDKQWFQLSLEEAFYLCYSLKCLKISGGNSACPQTDEELWHCLKSKKETFPRFFKAYSHLRMKNWVVRSGSQYGVDFVVYRHHPTHVHSEYGVLVLSGEEDGKDLNGRLRVWSDVHCTARLLGSVAKILLVLYVNKMGNNDDSPSCLANYKIEERTITRWSPEQCRENRSSC